MSSEEEIISDPLTDTNTKEELSQVVPESVDDDQTKAPASFKTPPRGKLEDVEDEEVSPKTDINHRKNQRRGKIN